MKKILLFFIGLAFAMTSGSVAAQDTLDILQKTNYYSHSGCDLDSLCKNYGFNTWGGWQNVCGSEMAAVFISNTALTVYGIVACLTETFPEESVYDTSYDHSIQHLRLYLPSAGGPQCVRQARIHLHHTPISYYADFHDVLNGMNPYIPTYERYFDSAITVTGKFYCGMTYTAREPYHADNGHTYGCEYPQFYLMEIHGLIDWSGDNHYTYDCLDTIWSGYTRCGETGTQWREECYGHGSNTKLLIFPILTPPDSTYVPDTASADGPSLADRLTGVMPNPASEIAKIVSSFGLTHVEIYNSKGTKIYDQPATDYSTTVNTSNWPAGIYIVRIYTPYGTATKRLTIVR